MSGRRAHLALPSRRPVAGANPPRAREGHPARSRPRRFPRAPPRAAASGDLRHSAPQETPITRTIVVLCHDVTATDAAGLFSTANLLQGRVDVWCRCVTAGLYLSDDVRRDAEVVLVLIPPVRSSSADAAPGPVRSVRVRGDAVRGLAPAEARVAALLQRAMQHASIDRLADLGRDRNAAGAAPDADAGAAADRRRVRKSARNAAARRAGWVASRPGARGPVPGFEVTDHIDLETCLGDALGTLGTPGDAPGTGDGDPRAHPSVALLDADAEAALADATLPAWRAVVVGDDRGVTPADRAALERVASVRARALGPRTLLASHCVVLAHAANDAREGGVPEAAEAEAAEDEGTREGGRTVAGRRVRG